MRRLWEDTVDKIDAEATQRAATLSASEQRSLCSLSQSVQDIEQPQQPQEHLPS